MPAIVGLGTMVNVVAIIAGGLIGMVSGKLLKERYQETIIKAQGFAIVVMALSSTLSQMFVVEITQEQEIRGTLSTRGAMMMIVTMALGALVGEIINIDDKFERFGTWLKAKSGNQNDSRFVDAFVTSSLTVCIGAMAIIGSIQDGISHDYNTLFAKAVLDFIIIIMMTASMGKGCIFSAIPVAIFQGSFTLLARIIEPIMTEAALSNISLVGNVLIMCVGINLIWPKTIRVANVLPALVFAVVAAFF